MLIAVPMRDGEALIGTIELFVKGHHKDCQLFNQDGAQYWQDISERYANALGSGLGHLMAKLVDKVQFQQSLVQNELTFEIAAFIPPQF